MEIFNLIISTPLAFSMVLKTSQQVIKLSNCKSGILLVNNNLELLLVRITGPQLLLWLFLTSLVNKPFVVSVDGQKMSKTIAIKMLFLYLLAIKLIFLNKEWSQEMRHLSLREIMKCFIWRLQLKTNKMQREPSYGQQQISQIKWKEGLLESIDKIKQ